MIITKFYITLFKKLSQTLKMKKIITLLVFVALTTELFAQDELKPFNFKFFPSIHVGFFDPSDVNNYISEDLSEYTITFGTTDMIMNFTLGIGSSFRFFNLFELQPVAEYSISPKIISGADESYTFSKFSGGLIGNFLIPVAKNRKHSILIGGGMIYNNLSFKEFNGSSLNPRFQAGFSLNNNKFNPQIILSIDMAKTTDNSNEIQSFNLDYSSFRIGVNLCF